MAKAKVIVVGGGASGIIAAITASRLGAKVIILERKDKIGRKILATGNGRCNLTNKNISTNFYFNEKDDIDFLKKIFNEFNIDKTLQFFNELGIEIVEKESGRLYPRSDQANSILSVLLLELERLGVEIICNEEVTKVEINKNIKVFSQNNKYYCSKLIIAAGGRSCPNLGSNGSGFKLANELGHSINKVFPSLVQLKTDYPFLKHLKGTKIIGVAKLLNVQKEIIAEDFGEILFTDYGVSGPPILQISRYASYNFMNNIDTYVILDLVPEYSAAQLDDLLKERFHLTGYKEAKDSLIGFINNRLIVPILKTSEIELNKKTGNITKLERKKIAYTLKNVSMKLIGTMDYNNSQVTAGGIKLSEINVNTMASNLIKDVYFCGEILDVDGICGGYNLQWAWSSGYVAGKNAALN